MKSIETPMLLPCLLRTKIGLNQAVSVYCFRVDILTVRALVTDLNLLLIYF
ncbi:hypothetical protein BDZ91DRAFT_709823 [Kalaharituber pfeilii]|nr:hypothetical protein BDZ91DRAFT_709823 [Kalaharituber pfeilii]